MTCIGLGKMGPVTGVIYQRGFARFYHRHLLPAAWPRAPAAQVPRPRVAAQVQRPRVAAQVQRPRVAAQVQRPRVAAPSYLANVSHPAKTPPCNVPLPLKSSINGDPDLLASNFALQKTLTFAQMVGSRCPYGDGRSYSTAAAKEADPVKDYLREIKTLFMNNDLCDSPHRVYNVDEKLFLPRFFHGDIQTEVMKNLRLRIQDAAQCPNFVLMGGGNAAGEKSLPVLVFPRHHVTPRVKRGLGEIDAIYTLTETGFSNNRVFRDYLLMLVAQSEELPIVVIVDGHRSHVGKFTRDWARDVGVIISVLPPRTSHLLQPMDHGIFPKMERIFLDRCEEFLMRRPPETIMMSWEVANIVFHAYAEATTRNRLREAFTETNVFPTEFVQEDREDDETESE